MKPICKGKSFSFSFAFARCEDSFQRMELGTMTWMVRALHDRKVLTAILGGSVSIQAVCAERGKIVG